MKPIFIPIEISARHVHLTTEDWQKLFATPHPTLAKLISQRPQFLALERVELIGPKDSLRDVGVVGPVRPYTQVELSMSDARHLGVAATVAVSGDQSQAAEITIRGPKGQLTAPVAIIPQRHIHASPEDADRAGIRHGDLVSIRTKGPRAGQLDQVIVRIHPTFSWHVHLDTDEANALGAKPEQEAMLILHP